MDAFIEKLEEYGLYAQTFNLDKLNGIKEMVELYKEYNKNEVIPEKLLDVGIEIRMMNWERFKQKIGIQEQIKSTNNLKHQMVTFEYCPQSKTMDLDYAMDLLAHNRLIEKEIEENTVLFKQENPEKMVKYLFKKSEMIDEIRNEIYRDIKNHNTIGIADNMYEMTQQFKKAIKQVVDEVS